MVHISIKEQGKVYIALAWWVVISGSRLKEGERYMFHWLGNFSAGIAELPKNPNKFNFIFLTIEN